MGTWHRTSDWQEHKIILHAEPEQDTIFYLRVTACRGRGSHHQDERFAWVASQGQMFDIKYFIRGYHACKDVWEPLRLVKFYIYRESLKTSETGKLSTS